MVVAIVTVADAVAVFVIVSRFCINFYFLEICFVVHSFTYAILYEDFARYVPLYG